MRLAAGICVGIVLGSLTYVTAQTTKTIIMRDACDPTTFNAAVGPGTCVSGNHGNTLFSDFIGELQSDHIAGGWRFNPLLNATEGHFSLARLDLQDGDQTTIENKGGEEHTFTITRQHHQHPNGKHPSRGGERIHESQCRSMTTHVRAVKAPSVARRHPVDTTL